MSFTIFNCEFSVKVSNFCSRDIEGNSCSRDIEGNYQNLTLFKGIESLPQTLVFYSLFLWNPMSEILDISNYEFY